ncbi:protein kinase domain-containing protein [Streptomyces huiliensis]|uniref:protein kinase domain-containing protein n=1 Tax=Streptomyces huiliensis TaxID=2876027 RepID=UPI001CBCEAC5|nr:PQQ-binding-like beta-propeller repeat protein [Streptomyces huiliensis]MBZ4321980.1 PQQ-binding-like beta-propeller repeat protein [Streptomyces huiliensis]
MDPLTTGDPLRLGPYRLVGVLGAGGMGKVYLGQDAAGGMAAVKVLHPEMAHDPHMAQRFVREAQAAQAVTSAGVARVLGAWTEGGRPWIATEFLAGPTLDEAVERHGPFDEAGVRALGAALARTLGDIHAAGLVHRDIKPPNIVLTSSGPRVIDFGIARPEHGLTLTTTGTNPVTPGYGAPEQVLGRRVGPPGDVFSLGAVLAFAATGRRAYDGTDVAAVQYKVVHEEPDLAGLPASLHALIAPCLAREPGHRPQPALIATAMAPPKGADRVWRRGALAADVTRREADAHKLTTLTVTSAPATPSRRRLVTALVAGGVTVAAAGGTGAWWFLRGDGKGEALKADPAPPAQSWDAKLLKAGEYEEGRPPAELWGPVRTFSFAPAPLPVRGLVIAMTMDGLAAFDVRDGKLKWQAKSEQYGRFAGRSGIVATPFDRGRLVGLDAATGDERWSADVDADHVLAMDDTTVYFVDGARAMRPGRLGAFDLRSRTVRWAVPHPDREPSHSEAALTVPARNRLIVHGQDGGVHALDTATGRTVWKTAQRPYAHEAVQPAVRGDLVYLGGKTLAAHRLENGEEVWSLPSASYQVSDTVSGGKTSLQGWSGPLVDGDFLYAVDTPRLYCLDRRTGKTLWTHQLNADAYPPLTPPTVQGRTLWFATGGSSGAARALDKRSGRPLWSYTWRGSVSPWLVGSGNRVFLSADGSLTAMPVV